jgi:hypothetical protein
VTGVDLDEVAGAVDEVSVGRPSHREEQVRDGRLQRPRDRRRSPTNKIMWQYGHRGKPGTAPGYLDTPDGLDLAPPNSLDIRFARRT